MMGRKQTREEPPQLPSGKAAAGRHPPGRRTAVHGTGKIFRTALVLLFFFLSVTAILLGEQNPAPGVPRLVIARSGEPVKLDGRLDETAWSRAEGVAELVQQAPRPGEATPYQTTVRALLAGESLYISFDCRDPEPSRIAVHTRQRDGSVLGDDTVAVVLDTYGDRRTGYFFQVNAAGARVDGLISGPELPKLDWDGIWDARIHSGPEGWTAEIAIPLRTLSFARSLDRWGINFERKVARDRTALRWVWPTLDSFFYDLSRAGELSGMQGLRQGLGWEISPSLVGRMTNDFTPGGRAWTGAPGADVTYRITPQMAAVFTANTDFAETEVDSRQLNLTRFPLFFPERRTFFLEGANQYEFGLGLSDWFIPFFSRRIGLYRQQVIPIDAGVKLNGRAGRWNLGLLDVQTRDTFLRGESSDPVPGTNLFAGRVSYDVNSRLRLGTLVTRGDPDGVHKNTLTGFDAVWRTSEFMGDKNFLVGGWSAFSSGDIRPGDRSGWGFKVDYPNDLWDCYASLNHFGEALDPAMGFLPRPGTRRLDASCEFKPRPGKNGPFRWIRQQFMEHRFYRVTNYRGELESWRFFWAPVHMQLESGDRFEFNWVPWYEYLPEPFPIGGVMLPVGGYRYDRFRAEFETSPHRPWEFGTTSWFGSFYNGHLLQQENYLRYTSPSGTWQLGVTSDQNFGHLAQGNFVQRLWQLNMAYAFNPSLVLTSFLQYDSESQNVGNNMRLRWTIKPGNDLFVVWNRGWKRLILSRDEAGLLPESDLIAVKLRWTFRY